MTTLEIACKCRIRRPDVSSAEIIEAVTRLGYFWKIIVDLIAMVACHWESSGGTAEAVYKTMAHRLLMRSPGT